MVDPGTSSFGFGPVPDPGTPDHQLSRVLSEFARTLGTDFPIQAILDHLVLCIVDVLPISAAGVTVISPGADPRYVAASDGSALRFEQLQTELGQGPCIAAYETGEAVAVPDLREDGRFPQFAPRALAEGLMAVFTFPLGRDHRQLGALDLYRSAPGMLDSGAMAAAQTLADVAAAYLLNAEARAELQKSTEQAHRMSLHDALTGLPNRILLIQRLDHAILRCRRSGKTVAILFADLDGFKGVNDTYGHHVGDALLVAVADRMTGLLRPGDTLARLAGDEFVILCEDLDEASQVWPVAHRIGAAVAEPFVLSGIEVQITASVGIAFAGGGNDLSGRVLQDADAAMYQAKRKGGARQGVVDQREQGLANRRLP
jgi:diguanylate cyclase (GGDEF)-like protein